MIGTDQLLPIVSHSRVRRRFSSSESVSWYSFIEKGIELSEGLSVLDFLRAGPSRLLDEDEDFLVNMSVRDCCRLVAPVAVFFSVAVVVAFPAFSSSIASLLWEVSAAACAASAVGSVRHW